MSFCTACGHPRSGPVRYCTACGAPFNGAVSSETPVTEPPASTPPLSATDGLPDPLSAYRPPAPVQAGAVASQQPGGGVAEQNLYGDIPESHGEASGGSPEPSGTTSAEHRAEQTELPYFTPVQPGRNKRTLIAALMGVVVLAAGGGVAVWATHRHPARPSSLAAQAKHRPTSQTANGSSPSLTPSPTPSLISTPTPSPISNAGIVAVAPDVVQDLRTSRVETFLNSYFTAINDHSYRRYSTLLDRALRQGESAQDFYAGYNSTTDSKAMLTAISSIGPGSASAAVTFTSHQLPADSPSDTTCTDWNITLYLMQQGSRYVLRAAPSDYHAAYRAC